MTMVNHWGKWVSDNVPVGGVVNLSSLEHINDKVNYGSAINLTYENGWIEYKRHKTSELITAFWAGVADDLPHDDPQPTDDQIEEWQEEYNDLGDGPCTYLLGWVRDDAGEYAPDETKEYSAIVSYDTMTAQIVRSKWVSRGALCSPCYPGQVDLDSPGAYLGYDFPEALYGDARRNPNDWLRWLPEEQRTLDRDGDSVLEDSPSPAPAVYTVTVQVHRVIDGIVQINPSIYEEENLFYATVQAPRADLQRITNIARGLYDLANDQLRSMPE